jgi:hypothetical protein
MAIDNNGPESPYPGPAEPGSGKDVYPDSDAERNDDDAGDLSRGDLTDDPDMPVNPPVDEAEEPSPGSSA